MGTEQTEQSHSIRAIQAVIGQCFRGSDGEADLLFALRDEGLFIKCSHAESHEIKVA